MSFFFFKQVLYFCRLFKFPTNNTEGKSVNYIKFRLALDNEEKTKEENNKYI